MAPQDVGHTAAFTGPSPPNCRYGRYDNNKQQKTNNKQQTTNKEQRTNDIPSSKEGHLVIDGQRRITAREVTLEPPTSSVLVLRICQEQLIIDRLPEPLLSSAISFPFM